MPLLTEQQIQDVISETFADGGMTGDDLLLARAIEKKVLELNALPEYETAFQHAVTELVMRHIDRMNDICEQDTADQIINSFTSRFDPVFETYLAKKFPGRNKR